MHLHEGRPPLSGSRGWISLTQPPAPGVDESGCGGRPRLTFSVMCCLDVCCQVGLEEPNCKFPFWLCSADKVLAKQPFLPKGPDTAPAYPWVVGFSSLPACKIIQTSQSHSPVGTKGHLIFLILQNLPPPVACCSLCSQALPHVVLHGRECPPSQAVSSEDPCTIVEFVQLVLAVVCLALPITIAQEPLPPWWGA